MKLMCSTCRRLPATHNAWDPSEPTQAPWPVCPMCRTAAANYGAGLVYEQIPLPKEQTRRSERQQLLLPGLLDQLNDHVGDSN